MKQTAKKKALSRFTALAFALAGLGVGLWLAPQSALATSVPTTPPTTPPTSAPSSGAASYVALTITKSQNGTAGVKGIEQVGETYRAVSVDSEVSINAIPGDGYVFSHWSSSSHNDTKLAALLSKGVNSAENSFKMPKNPITLAANFIKATDVKTEDVKTAEVTVTAKNAPEIYSGFRNRPAAALTVTETGPEWAMEKDNIFTLSDKDGTPLDNVKISSVTFTNVVNVAANINRTNYAYDGTSGGLYSIGDAEIIIKDNILTLKNFIQTATGGKKNAASFDMVLNLSAEAGFEGEVYVTPSLAGVNSEYEPMLIATVVSPIEISTKTTEVQIGYSVYPIADITITEKAPGVLAKDTELYLTIVSSTGSVDITFNTITLAKNIEIDSNSKLQLSLKESKGPRIGFEVATESKNAPAVITLKGLETYINRSVPFGDYSLIASGTVVAENYVASGELYDGFRTEGVTFDKYIHVNSENADPDVGGKVQITIGSNVLVVGENEIEMDTAPFIEKGSAYVPVSYIALALGIGENGVIWDPVTKTVTINISDRIIQFTQGSSVITINGVSTDMTDADGNLVYALNVDGRIFIPFRALGEAYGVTVNWDEETRTATFN